MGPVPIIEAEAPTQPNVRRPFIAILTRRGDGGLQAPWDEPRSTGGLRPESLIARHTERSVRR